MSVATTADDFAPSAPEKDPALARKGFLSRMFNAAVKAAPTAVVSAGLGFALRTTALSAAITAGAGTAATLAAISAASGTSAALVTAGKEVWAGRKEGRSILETLSSRDVLKKVRNNFAIAAGFGAVGAAVAPLVIDYVRHIDFGAAASKVADFLIPTASAYDYSIGDGNQHFLDMSHPHAAPASPATAMEASTPATAAPQHVTPAPAPAPATTPTAPIESSTPPHNNSPAAPAQTPEPPPAPMPGKAPLERIQTLTAGADAARFEGMTSQQLKDEGVRLLWGKGVPKNPELARALFETSAASGNRQAVEALAFMDKHGMALPAATGTGAVPAPAAPTAPAAPASPGQTRLPKGILAARCDVTRPAMEGLTLTCDVKSPTMLPGDRIEVTNKGRLTRIFYEGVTALREAANRISTGAFMTGRVAPVMLAQDPDLVALIEEHRHKIPAKPDLALK